MMVQDHDHAPKTEGHGKPPSMQIEVGRGFEYLRMATKKHELP